MAEKTAKKKRKKEFATKEELNKAKTTTKELRKKITSLTNKIKKLQNSLNKTKVNQMQDMKGIKAFVNDKVAQIQTFNKVIQLNDAKMADLKAKMLKLESQIAQTVSTSAVNTKSDQQIAHDLVELYFEEVARLGFKRSLDLDSIINAYYYTLERIKRRDIELHLVEHEVKKTEQKIAQIEKDIEQIKQPISSTPERLPTNEPYSFTNSKGQKYFLHQRGKLFYFSKDPDNAISLPAGLKVVESPKTGLPIVKKK